MRELGAVINKHNCAQIGPLLNVRNKFGGRRFLQIIDSEKNHLKRVVSEMAIRILSVTPLVLVQQQRLRDTLVRTTSHIERPLYRLVLLWYVISEVCISAAND